MTWIKFDTQTPQHPKIITLAEILGLREYGDEAALGLLAKLWCWCIEHAEDGSLTNCRPAVIARAAGWRGDPELFVNALVEARLLDHTDTGLAVHDWWDYAGRLVEERRRDRERKAKGVPPAFRRSSTGTPAAVQDSSCGKSKNKREHDLPTVDQFRASVPEAQSATTKPGKVKKTMQVKVEEADVPTFAEFWELYPRRKDKQRTETTWNKLTAEKKRASFEGLKWQLPGMMAEIAAGRGQYIKYPTTWLNAGSFEDDAEPTLTTDVVNHLAGDDGFRSWCENYAEQRKKLSPGEFINYVLEMQRRKGVQVGVDRLREAWESAGTDCERVQAMLRVIFVARQEAGNKRAS